MCGIAGFVDFSARPDTGWHASLELMERALAHRGPDGWGRTLLAGSSITDVSATRRRTLDRAASDRPRATVGLVHRRLAIIDLSDGGHQPMTTADHASWIVYNGELYNYRALRNELVATGTGIRGASDTEVLLALLTARDVQALPLLHGMFAFAWWDERAERLVLARDRFGIKPLVFTQSQPGRWCFASEPAALAAAGELALRSEPAMRDTVLARGAVGDDESFWQNLQTVAPGEVVVIDAGGVTRHTYWSLADVLLAPRPRPTRTADAAAVLRDALAASVQAHLVSDVPVGLFLSGGLDSAAILATVRNIGAGPIQTFTVTMGDAALDEADAARHAAKQFGGDHTELRVGDLDLDQTLDEFFAAMSEPSVDGLNTFIVARAARQAGVRVALSGVGGDEVLGGYPSFTKVPQLSALLRGVSPVGRAGLSGAASLFGGSRADKIRAIAGGAPDIASVWWHYRAVSPSPRSAELPAHRLPPQARGASPFAIIRYLEMREFLQRQLLRDADAFTMCCALELRTPMVDHQFVTAMAAVGEWPRDGARSHKAALFAALPELTRAGAVRERKQGFVLPMSRWMRESLSSRAPSRWRDLRPRLESGGDQTLIERFLAGRVHWSRLWVRYVLARMARS
jgi:asparagine synthase (glutamine-hydrolysing)